MTDPIDLATRYIAAWNETEPGRRHDLVAALWTEDGSYRDPVMGGSGHDQVDALIAATQARFPQFRFVLSGRPADGHGEHLRFSWDLGPDGGEAVVGGTDFVELAPGGRIRSVVGFLDRVPA